MALEGNHVNFKRSPLKQRKTAISKDIFEPNSSPENDVAEERKVEVIELIFYVVTKNVVVFDAASWKSAHQHSKMNILKLDLFSLLLGTREKNVIRLP